MPRLDFSASYTPIESLTLAFHVANILAEPFQTYRNYVADASFPRNTRYEERVYSVGVRFRY